MQKSMVSCLQSRYEDLRIYTYIGNVLIAINPFQRVNIYDYQVWSQSMLELTRLILWTMHGEVDKTDTIELL